MAREREEFRRLPAVAIAVMAWLALFPITDIDVYYHLATGKRILDEGHLPVRGVGSATFGAAPWHDNEWGFQAIAAAIGRTERDPSGVLVLTPAGRAALILFRAGCLAATLALVSATLRRRGVAPLTRALAVVLAAFLTFGNLFWDVRPQILSYLALAGLVYLLERDREGARFAAPAMLAVVALWANVHGAFLVGIALIGATGAGALADGFRDRESRRRGVRLVAVAAAAPLAACLNPWGYEQVLHPFLYLLRPDIHAGNAEWTRPHLSRLPLFLGTLAATVGAWAARGRPRYAEIAPVAAFAVLFLSAIRHLPLAVLVVVPALAAAATEAAARGGRRALLVPSSPSWGPPAARAAAAALVAIGIVGLSGARFIRPWPCFEERIYVPMPERAARFLARERVPGTGFNTYRFGSFLMFRLYPEERVFIDGRNDLYREFTNDVYLPILWTAPGWERRWSDAVARYGIGWVLVDDTDPIASALRSDPEWLPGPPGRGPVVDGESGRDGIALFLRNTPANRERLARWPGMP